MYKQHATYRLFASLFAILLVLAPISQNWAYNVSIEQVKEVKQASQEEGGTEDDSSSDDTVLVAASTFHAVITAGFHLNFEVVYHAYDFPEPLILVKEILQTPVLPTQSGYIQNICAYYIAPHAP